MEQSRKHFSVLKFTYIFGICTFLVYMLSCLIASAITNTWSYFCSSIYCTLCGILSIYLGDLNGKLIGSFAKNKSMPKFWKYFILIFSNFFKMFLIILPLLTILLIKVCGGDENIFEMYSTIAGTFISPCYIIISQIVLLKLSYKNGK